MNPKINYSFLAVASFIGLTFLAAMGSSKVFNYAKKGYESHQLNTELDSPKLKYPLQDTQNSSDDHKNPIDLKDPSNIKDSVYYDPNSNEYILQKTIGGQFYRDPTYMSFDEYLKYESKKEQDEYFDDKGSSSNVLTRKGAIPSVNINNLLVDRLFGGDNVDIRPQGNIELTFGGNFTNIQNPSLTVQQRKQGGFNFDMNIQMNVIGKIGDKLKITTNYNTQAQFDFEKQVKLEYTGHSDEIIKKIEAGNVSLPLTTQLISGSQSLFGIKTQLQFGRLKVTALASQQKSQTQNITIQGGQQTQTFKVAADQYDQNRNFFLAQYFRNQYNSTMQQIPTITSAINITKVEVWVTNTTGATVNTRNIVALMDLGESSPANKLIKGTGNTLPFGFSQPSTLNSNSLYSTLTSVGSGQLFRSLNTSVSQLNTIGLVQGLDFEPTYARELAPTEFTLQPQLGFIMLNTQLNPGDVLAIAYQYTKDGKTYQVGEFAEDVAPNPTSANVLFLKLLKGTAVYPKLPIWNLMMKNIYSLGAFGISQTNFLLNVTYLDPAGGERRYLPAAPLNGTPLIQVLGLDRLNTQNEPQPDGIFDFLPGITISPQNGKIIFPELEPFGQSLTKAFDGSPNAANYVYQVLYDSVITVALEFPQFDRFYLTGTYQSSNSSSISLGAFNIPQGSVTVTAGGRVLQENVDYTIDYNLGRLTIINTAILSSGVPINVKFENNPAFVFTQKTLLAARADYYINDNFKLGGTIMRLSERPFTQKLNVGSDPIANTIMGLDGNYKTDAPWLTKALNYIPLINTKEKSTITIAAEGAKLIPGHPPVIGKDGTVYIDDFEGTESTYDLKFPFTSWALASTPSEIPNASKINDLSYGYGRGKLQWYNIDPFFYTGLAPNGINGNDFQQYGFYTRQIFQTDIFPNAPSLDQNGLPPVLTTFDLRFDPTQRGPYNYDVNRSDVGANGSLTRPTSNWGGIMRALDYTDFVAANIGFVQFWVLYPYSDTLPQGNYGNLFVELGDVSEDILKDSRMFFENALPIDGSQTGMESTIWSYVPSNGLPPIIEGAFDVSANSRQFQDVGFDGASDAQESVKYASYVTALSGISTAAGAKAAKDPSGDDYRYYRDPSFDAYNAGVIGRYIDYNGTEGNSPITNSTSTISFSETNIPDCEDLNHDNTLNQNESYYLYKFSLNPADLQSTGQNFIADVVKTPAKNGSGASVGNMTWIHVKIPITSFISQVGGISGFQSIRFIRMYMQGMSQPVILRFGYLELLRDQWREYTFSLQSPGEYIPNDHGSSTYFNVTSVSFQSDGQRQPINYLLPPGVQQQLAIGTVTNYLQNESSLSEQVCNLADGDARAAYKDINLDLRNYDSLNMFVHAESVIGQAPLNNGNVTAFIRLGSDFTDNYYEYELPLTISAPGVYNNNSGTDQLKVWPAANNFTVSLSDLTSLKVKRNSSSASLTVPYVTTLANGARISIVGNPDLGNAKVAMLGVRNPLKGSKDDINDNGQPVCTEVWFDELRVSGFNEQGGYAGLARMDVKLADLGTVSLSGNFHTIGFGSVDQTLDQRYTDNFMQYNASATLELGRFLPKFIGLKIPMYIGITKSFSTPKYDPYELDVTLKNTLALVPTSIRDSVKRAAQTITSIKSLNFTNVRRVNPKKSAKLRIYSLENLTFTYAYTQTLNSSPTIQSDLLDKTHAEIGYAFPGKAKFITPFSKLFGKGKYFKLIKDFNFNLLPTNLSFKTQVDRIYEETLLRPISVDDIELPTFNKSFTNDRFYTAKWEITKSLNVDFSATNNAYIDEPAGAITTQQEKDSILRNLKSLGRTVHYHQSASASYTIPINKIPILDWTNFTAKYSADYDWLALPQVLDTSFNSDGTIRKITQVANPLGNTLSNTQNMSFNADFNFRNLYGKWKWLKRYDTNSTPPKTNPKDKNAKGKQPPAPKPEDKKLNNKDAPPGPSVQAFLIRLLISLKKVNFSYTQNQGSVIPGFVYNSNILGENLSNRAPGFDYIFGLQPDTNWLRKASEKGWLTKDTSMNYQFIQTLSRTLTMRGSFEPARDFNIDVNVTRTYTLNSNAVFRATSVDPANPQYTLLSPQQNGTFSISYIALRTAFIGNNNGNSPVFQTFSNDRIIIAQRLKLQNPNSDGGQFYGPIDTPHVAPGFPVGYGPYSQDVLIPAFIAAYSGQSPNQVLLTNFFNMLPKPNWRITYNGLNKIEWFKTYVNNVSITDAYTSSLNFGNFTNSLLYQGKNANGVNTPMVIDSTSGNFIPYYDIQSVSISENFSPLIGVDVSWKGGLTTKLEYGMGRNVSLSMLNYQVFQTNTTNVTFNVGYKWKKFPIPFKIRGKKRRLKNDINLSLQLGYNKNETDAYRLDLNQPAVPTQGNTVIQISPAIDYQVSSKLTVRLFVDKRFTIPSTSATYPINYTSAGVKVRFTLQ